MNISEIVQSSGWKNFMAKLYGMGAAVVIVGALFKIMHWNGWQIFLPLGLIVEAIIFMFSAFEPLHEELDWTLVYPELAGMTDPDEVEGIKEAGKAGQVTLERFEDLVSNADVGPATFKRLGDSLEKSAMCLPIFQILQKLHRQPHCMLLMLKQLPIQLGNSQTILYSRMLQFRNL